MVGRDESIEHCLGIKVLGSHAEKNLIYLHAGLLRQGHMHMIVCVWKTGDVIELSLFGWPGSRRNALTSEVFLPNVLLKRVSSPD